jgi:lipid A 3-O-deacylase
LPFWSKAQENKTNDYGSFSFYFGNDLFAGTDRCFTGSLKLSWMSKNLKNYQKNPWLKCLPFVKKPEFRHAISISLGENVFTPDNIKLSNLSKKDRPYAGFLYLAIGLHSRSNLRLDTLEIDLGIVGPHSYAEQLQKSIHELFNFIEPKGWHNQLKDEFALQAIYERKWKLWQSGSRDGFGFDLIPHLGGGLGNIYIYAYTGAQVRFGWNLPDDFGISLVRPGGDCNVNYWSRRSSGIHIFAAVDGKAVLQDIFLDGNTIRDSHSVDKNTFLADILVGIDLRFGRFNLSYSYVFWTKRFEIESKGQIFGAFKISYSY